MYTFARWFWVVALGNVALNGWLTLARARREKYRSAERDRHYSRLVAGQLIVLATPWVTVGILTEVGLIQSLFDVICRTEYDSGKFIVIAAIVLIDIFFFAWLFAGDGAAVLSAYPAIIRHYLAPQTIKLIAVILLILQLASLVMAFTEILPPPPTA